MTRSATAYWSDRWRARLACRPGACRPVVERFARAGLLAMLAGALAGPALAQPTEVGKVADAGLATEDRFGNAVAIGGGLAVAGAPFREGYYFNSGAAYVYREIAGSWADETSFAIPTDDSSNDDWFGAAVATDGQIVAVGAPKTDAGQIDAGAVYVYRYDSITGWSAGLKLTAPDGGTGDQFGAAVAIVGDALLIGAPFDDGKGSAYVYRYNGVSSWVFEGKMQSATTTAGAQFGVSLDGVGGRALIGAPLQTGGGRVSVFDQAGSVWTESVSFTSTDNAGDDQFGSSIAFDGAKALIGAHLDDQLDSLGANIPNAGAAYVISLNGAAWNQDAKLTAGADASGQANFGFSGDLAGGTAVVGAFQAHTAAGQSTGAAYVFRLIGTDWVRQSVIVAGDTVGGDFFGYDIDGIDTVMIGAPTDEPDGTTLSASGSAYFFTLDPALDQAPIADAGADMAVRENELVVLDGGDSFDDNTASADLVYAWSFITRPEGSSAVLQPSDDALPTFFADVAGTYEVKLIVTDSVGQSSAPDYIVVSSDNVAPQAVAGDDLLVLVGTVVELDGSSSTDPEDYDSLDYEWTLTAPAGSNSIIGNADMPFASFVADVEGVFEVTLVVSDFIGAGYPDTISITATTASDYAEYYLLQAAGIVAPLEPGQVTTKGNRTAFLNFLHQAANAIQQGDIQGAVDKIEKALERTDGCVLRGFPDGNGPGRDWIIDCDAQQSIYGALTEARVALIE